MSINPSLVPYGPAAASEDVTLIELANETTSAIVVTVRPPDSVQVISGMRLRCVRFPYWERRLPIPPSTTVVLPINNCLPRNLEIAVDLDLIWFLVGPLRLGLVTEHSPAPNDSAAEAVDLTGNSAVSGGISHWSALFRYNQIILFLL